MARLHDENIRAANVFENLEINFAITESAEQRFPQRNVQMTADALRQHWVCGPRKNLEAVFVHFAFAPQLFRTLKWPKRNWGRAKARPYNLLRSKLKGEGQKLKVRNEKFGTKKHPSSAFSPVAFNSNFQLFNFCGVAEGGFHFEHTRPYRAMCILRAYLSRESVSQTKV